jgi:enoyl-CoA hydratase/carnithine racemase
VGLVNEVVAAGNHLDRAVEIARLIAANAPLAVQAALASARAAERGARDAAARALLDWNQKVMQSRDAGEGIAIVNSRPQPWKRYGCPLIIVTS